MLNGRHAWAKHLEVGGLPDFVHLLMTPKEFTAALHPFYEAEYLKWAAHSIYSHPFLNRLFFDDYMAIFDASSFSEVDAKGVWSNKVEPHTAELLLQRYPGRTGFEYEGIEMLAMRDSKF
jgi:hypothetical protein